MKQENLNFSVYEVYFNAIENGSKTTEYRDMTNDYWMKKLVDLSRYPNKSIDEIRDLLARGKVELYPIEYKTCTFWTNRKGKRVSLKIQWKGTYVYKGHTTFAIRLGDLLVDSNGNNVPRK